MKYPLVAYSWTAMSPNTVFKRMDKSTFIHRGTGVPKQLSWFFNIPDGDMLSPKNIQLHLDGKSYDARIELDVVHSKYHLFWLSDFIQEIHNRFPDHYDAFKNGQGIDESNCPIMRFDLFGDNCYSISWEISNVQLATGGHQKN